MDARTDKIVLICHYSAVRPIKCEIIEANDNTLTIKLVRQLAILNFQSGDPAVINIKEGDSVTNIGCNIVNVNQGEDIILLKIDTIEPGSEQRRHERFPVSLYADVRLKVKEKKYVAIVKDISFFGIKIFCKESFSIGEELNLDLYMENKIVFMKARVLRKVEHSGFYEYGLGIEYDNYDTLNFIKAFIRSLKSE